jgi:GT2 family glycosyltransferase
MDSAIQVIVVNFNAGEALVHCIRSVLESTEPLTVTLYDNASTDGSIDNVLRHFRNADQLQVIRGAENLGFARAVNAAAKTSAEDYLLILNPDCELLPGALQELRKALEEDPGAALAGPLVVNRDGVMQKGTLRNFPDPWRSFLTFSGLWRLGNWFESFHGVERDAQEVAGSVIEADAVSGACMLVRRRLFESLDGMDEAYGLHCEDLDLMYRLHQQGHHCLLVPRSRVFHQQGVSSRSRPAWVHRQKHLGMQRYFNKFRAAEHGWPVRWLVTAGIWARFVFTLPLALLRK